MDEKVKEAIFKKIEKEPFAKKFGIKLLELDEGYSKVEMKFTPDMENFLGTAHGGVLFALIDEPLETAALGLTCTQAHFDRTNHRNHEKYEHPI